MAPRVKNKKTKKYIRSGGGAVGISMKGKKMFIGTGANKIGYGRSMAFHGSPFPREFTTQVTYTENLVSASTSGATVNYLFSANGLYDPNISGTGAQPRFFDTLCGANNGVTPYNQYRVTASKISCTIVPTGVDSVGMRAMVGIGLFNSTASAPSTLAELIAREDFGDVRPLGYWSGGHDIAYVKRYSGKIARLFDVIDIRTDEDLTGVYNANPTKEARWCITHVPMDETSSYTYRLMVKITYYVTFLNKNDVADS